MTRLNCIAWLLLSICAAAAAPVSGQTKVKTSVEKVTLFIDGAQVTRTEQVDIPAGNSTLVFTGLSPYLDDKSMQVAAKGRFTVTAVNRLFNHTDSLERSARQQALEQELANIRQQQKKQQAAREVIDAESDLLKVNWLGRQPQRGDPAGGDQRAQRILRLPDGGAQTPDASN